MKTIKKSLSVLLCMCLVLTGISGFTVNNNAAYAAENEYISDISINGYSKISKVEGHDNYYDAAIPDGCRNVTLTVKFNEAVNIENTEFSAYVSSATTDSWDKIEEISFAANTRELDLSMLKTDRTIKLGMSMLLPNGIPLGKQKFIKIVATDSSSSVSKSYYIKFNRSVGLTSSRGFFVYNAEKASLTLTPIYSPLNNEYNVSTTDDTIYINCTAATPKDAEIKVGDTVLTSGQQKEIDLTKYKADSNGVKTVEIKVNYIGTGIGSGNVYKLHVDTKDHFPKIKAIEQTSYTCEQNAPPTLKVELDGEADGTVTYQWCVSKDSRFVNIEGEISNTFTPILTYARDYTYICKVTNTYNGTAYMTMSDYIYVTATANHASAAEITEQPKALDVIVGSTAGKLSVKAIPNDKEGVLSYQWYVTDSEDGYDAGTAIANATENEYVPDMSQCGDKYYYCVVKSTITTVKNETDSADLKSDIAKVSVINAKDYLGLNGEGTEESPLEISSADDFVNIKKAVDKGFRFDDTYFVMTQNIELPMDWEPIGSFKDGYTDASNGTTVNPFMGNLDGGGYQLTIPSGRKALFNFVREVTIKNLIIYGENIDGSGLINGTFVDYGDDGNYNTGCPWSAVVENVTLKSGSKTSGAGLIRGGGSGRNTVTVINSTIQENVIIGSEDTDEVYLGSIVGALNGSITDCKSYATVIAGSKATKVGGLVGSKSQSMGPCSVSNSYFKGTIKAISSDYVGGIIGAGYGVPGGSAPNSPVVSIINCYALGEIIGGKNVGGILGGEPNVENCWSNGVGSVSSNYFYGTLKSNVENANLGGIVGYMQSFNKYQGIQDNYYLDTCGTNKGIGYINTIITKDHEEYGAKYGIDYEYDDAKLCIPASEDDFNCGKVKDKLNAADSGYKNWIQQEDVNHPTHSDEPVLYAIELSGKYKTDYVIGDTFCTEGMVITGKFSDGTTKNVSLDDTKLNFAGFDSENRGVQTITVTYGVASTTFDVKILYKESQVKDIYVYFTLYGDESHGKPTETTGTHTFSAGNLDTWIAQTRLKITNNSTVKDVFEMALKENGMTWSNPTGNYVESITRNGVTLAEFTNGNLSGWMYTLNGSHSLLGVQEQFLNPGDVIVFHYTDDYTVEEGSDQWIIPGDGSTGGEVKDDTSDKTDEELKAEQIEQIKSELAKVNMKARSTKTAKGNVKVALKADTKTQKFIKEMKDMGYTVKYRFYRSTKKSSGYKSMLTKTSNTYTNTAGKKGVKYYYKVQVRVYDENGKCVAKTALKQCDYAYRTWTK